MALFINVALLLLLVLLVAYFFRKLLMARFFDDLMNFYSRRMDSRKKRLFNGLKELKAKRGDGKLVILDVGCGPGTNFQFYPPGSEVICVDPNRHFEPIVSRRIHNLLEVQVSQFHVGVAENLREFVEAESVDAVVATLVLCTVNDIIRSLQEILRVLKPVRDSLNYSLINRLQ